MKYLIRINRKSRWTINGKVYSECNPDEQGVMNRFFREEKLKVDPEYLKLEEHNLKN